jgi:hypothetical protein
LQDEFGNSRIQRVEIEDSVIPEVPLNPVKSSPEPEPEDEGYKPNDDQLRIKAALKD